MALFPLLVLLSLRRMILFFDAQAENRISSRWLASFLSCASSGVLTHVNDRDASKDERRSDGSWRVESGGVGRWLSVWCDSGPLRIKECSRTSLSIPTQKIKLLTKVIVVSPALNDIYWVNSWILSLFFLLWDGWPPCSPHVKWQMRKGNIKYFLVA